MSSAGERRYAIPGQEALVSSAGEGRYAIPGRSHCHAGRRVRAGWPF